MRTCWTSAESQPAKIEVTTGRYLKPFTLSVFGAKQAVARKSVARPASPRYPVPMRVGMVSPDRLPDFYREVIALPNSIQRDYLLLLLFTGMRNGETAAGAGGRTRFRFA
jgi:hypothetical protein